jgi:IclR family mhp operon transcriptional activator
MIMQLRSLDRGLRVLEHLNKSNAASAQCIAKATQLPLPTVYRILETLSHAGFVDRGPSPDKAYRLTGGVRRLSGGVTTESLFVSVATPVLLRRRSVLKWPSCVAKFEHDGMVILESTDQFSPKSIGLNAIGRRFPMLNTPLGWAYLAYCREEERQAILEHLRKSADPDDAPARNPDFVDRMIAGIRECGYASSKELPPERCSGIALPILHGGTVLGCIGTVWTATQLSHERAVPECLPVLQEAKLAIEAALDGASTDW